MPQLDKVIRAPSHIDTSDLLNRKACQISENRGEKIAKENRINLIRSN